MIKTTIEPRRPIDGHKIETDRSHPVRLSGIIDVTAAGRSAGLNGYGGVAAVVAKTYSDNPVNVRDVIARQVG